jgi:hypothetical protein
MDGKGNKEFISLGKLGHGVVVFMLVIIIALCIYILIEALTGVKETYRNVEEVIKQIPLASKNELLFNENGILKPSAKAYLTQLESRSRCTLDSGTISFLFQVFAIALVSAGVYLLSRSYENFRKIKEDAANSIKRTEMIEPFVRNNQMSIILTNYYSHAFLVSWLIKKEGSSQLFFMMRQALRQIEEQMMEANEQETGIEERLVGSFLDYSRYIRENLNPETPADILNTWEKCNTILRESEFAERYKKQMEELGSNSK